MKKTVKILLTLAASCLCVSALAGPENKADKETIQWRYEVENLGQKSSRGGQGTAHILKVWSFSKKAEIAEEQSKKNAIHAVVFQGVPANDEKRFKGIDALLQDPTAEATHAAFFKEFFADGGAYMRFVTTTNSGMADMLKVGKEWKVGLTVSVDTPGLRKYLEQSKVIVALSSGFEKAKKPSLMVVPSRNWCIKNGYMMTIEGVGETIQIPDYRKAFDNSSELNQVTQKIGGMMSARGFDLRLMSATLTSLQNEKAEESVMGTDNGGTIAEDPIDALRRVAKADIWMEVNWDVQTNGMQKSVYFELTGIDAYTNEQIASCQNTGKPSYSSELSVLMEEAVSNNLDNFNELLLNKFNDWFTNGRQIRVEIKVWDTSAYHLESDVNGDELGYIIQDWMEENTVNNQCSMDGSTKYRMTFTNVRIPMLNEKGRSVDAKGFVRNLQKKLQTDLQVPVKVDAKGLGQVSLIIGDK